MHWLSELLWVKQSDLYASKTKRAKNGNVCKTKAATDTREFLCEKINAIPIAVHAEKMQNGIEYVS
jgi:hypothetical protein